MTALHREVDTRIIASANDHELAGDDIHKRIAYLQKLLRTWVPAGGIDSVYSYERYQAFGVLPFAGGYLDQPAWVQDDFRMLGLWFELARLRGKMPAAKPGKKQFSEIAGLR